MYVISLIGEGPDDARLQAAVLVQALKDGGHRIYDATFTRVAGDGDRYDLEAMPFEASDEEGGT
jgi:hypothetical protein